MYNLFDTDVRKAPQDWKRVFFFLGMEQFEQLLTCAICLDRYRNPKLLPCQHSFCMEPCMDGLVDYVRRQVKCPECRAEHRIPYQVYILILLKYIIDIYW